MTAARFLYVFQEEETNKMKENEVALVNHLSNYTKTIILLSLSEYCRIIPSTIILHYYSTIAPFYHIRAKERAKYATLLHYRTGQKYGLKRSDKMAAQNEPNFALFTSWNGEIINPLFDGLTYNTSRHFAHCSYAQLAKYPRVLYVKPSNKVYAIEFCKIQVMFSHKSQHKVP